MPIGTHDTRLLRYTRMRLPYPCKETVQLAVEKAIAAASVGGAGEGRARRKKCVQLLADSALRRRMRMDRLELEAAPKGVRKAVKRRALANATNGESGEAKPVRTERQMHASRSENSHVGSSGVGSLRWRRLALYQGASEFSLVRRKE